MDGENKVEIGRYQARELDRKEASEVFRRNFKSSGDMPETIDKLEFDRLTPEVKDRLETLNEQETLTAFKNLEEGSPNAVITIFITVDDDFKNFTVTLKNDKKEIKLEKALLRLFTLNKSNDLKNQI